MKIASAHNKDLCRTVSPQFCTSMIQKPATAEPPSRQISISQEDFDYIANLLSSDCPPYQQMPTDRTPAPAKVLEYPMKKCSTTTSTNGPTTITNIMTSPFASSSPYDCSPVNSNSTLVEEKKEIPSILSPSSPSLSSSYEKALKTSTTKQYDTLSTEQREEGRKSTMTTTNSKGQTEMPMIVKNANSKRPRESDNDTDIDKIDIDFDHHHVNSAIEEARKRNFSAGPTTITLVSRLTSMENLNPSLSNDPPHHPTSSSPSTIKDVFLLDDQCMDPWRVFMKQNKTYGADEPKKSTSSLPKDALISYPTSPSVVPSLQQDYHYPVVPPTPSLMSNHYCHRQSQKVYRHSPRYYHHQRGMNENGKINETGNNAVITKTWWQAQNSPYHHCRPYSAETVDDRCCLSPSECDEYSSPIDIIYPPLPPLDEASFFPNHDSHIMFPEKRCNKRFRRDSSRNGNSLYYHRVHKPRIATSSAMRPRSVLTNSSASTSPFTNEQSSQNSMQPHHNRDILALSYEEDKNWLSEFLCFVRSECVEVFTASQRDVSSRMNSKKVMLDQAGIRCRYCAHLSHGDRVGRSSSFPSSLSRIYQSLTMMLRDHFTKCPEIPHHIKEKYLRLKANASQGATDSKKYWVESAHNLGLIDTESGIRLRMRSSRKFTPFVQSSNTLHHLSSSCTRV